jgi:transketolase
LYLQELKLGLPLPVENPNQRDVFVLSKGHAAPALYATLAEAGLISKNLLKTLRKIESPLQGHPERHRLPYIDATTGSLGQGISIAQGYAMGQKLMGSKNKAFCILGDGECQEGQVWETAMSAPKFGLDNLVCIIDKNGFQNEYAVEKTMPIDTPPLKDKWEAFGWMVETVDGHDFGQIQSALSKVGNIKGVPTLIIARTIKGKGVSFAEGNPVWHSKAIDQESYAIASKELLI